MSNIKTFVGGLALRFVGVSARKMYDPSLCRLLHLDDTVNRAKRIASALGLSLREMALVEIAAAFQDYVYESVIQSTNDSLLFRVPVKGNKERSAESAVSWMKSQTNENFTEDDFQIVTKAILVTEHSYSEENKTFIQERLQPDSHPVVRTVALADLGCAGMESGRFLGEVNRQFLKQNVSIFLFMINKEICFHRSIGHELQELHLDQYLKHLDSSIDFVKGRKNLFETELGNLGLLDKYLVRMLFSGFDRSISSLTERRGLSATASFEELIDYLNSFM